MGTMSTETPLTPAQRIELVQGDKARRYGQIIIAFILIGFSLGYLTWFSIYKADDSFLQYLGTGMLALVFAGIGAAYAIMGLGRTVGSTNTSNSDQIALIIAEMAKINQPPAPPVTDEFFEDNQDDDLEEERIDEVPPGKGPVHILDAVNVSPNQLQFLADRTTWHSELKTISGKPVVLVATQKSRRTKAKRTVYVYHVVGTNLIIYNRSRHGVFFMRIAFRPENMQQFFQTFVEPPVTPEEQIWLERYDYVLV